MTHRRVTWIVFVLATLVVTSIFLPAAADWLVTKRGERIETEGPWQVKSRLVVFKRPDGTYASLRLSDVDLEASKELTRQLAEEAARSSEPADARHETTRREPVARLTEKDLPPVGPRPTQKEEAKAAETAPADSSDSKQPKGLIVSTWREVTEIDSPGLAFVGEVRNPTDNMAVGVTVSVKLLDEKGEEIASTGAVLTTDALPPGSSGGFRASFPGVYDYVRADFDVEGTLLRTNRGTTKEDSEDGSPPESG